MAASDAWRRLLALVGVAGRCAIQPEAGAADVTRVKSFRPWPPVLLALLVIVSACGGESQTGFEGSLGALLRRPVAAGTTVNEMLFAAPEEISSPLDALVPCSEVAVLRPEDGSKPAGSVNLNSELITVLSEYGSTHGETFAGLWLDAHSSGGILLAFTDEVEPHREEILDRLRAEVASSESWRSPFGMVEVSNSRTELEAAARAIGRLDSAAVVSTAVELKKNRVVVNLIDPTEDEVTELAEVADLSQICGEVSAGAKIPEGPLEVLPQGGGNSLLSCDEVPFPASSLDEPLSVDAADHPAIPVLNTFTDGDPDWIVLDIAPSHALFAKYDGELRVSALATPAGDTWEISGWTFGCDLKIGLPIGLGAVEIFTAPDSPADPGDTTLDLLVSEVACAGGRAMGKRLLEPEVIETDEQVILAFAAATQDLEFLECPSNPVTEVQVRLAAPLAGRTVIDGTYLPPRPVGQPWFLE